MSAALPKLCRIRLPVPLGRRVKPGCYTETAVLIWADYVTDTCWEWEMSPLVWFVVGVSPHGHHSGGIVACEGAIQ